MRGLSSLFFSALPSFLSPVGDGDESSLSNASRIAAITLGFSGEDGGESVGGETDLRPRKASAAGALGFKATVMAAVEETAFLLAGGVQINK